MRLCFLGGVTMKSLVVILLLVLAANVARGLLFPAKTSCDDEISVCLDGVRGYDEMCVEIQDSYNCFTCTPVSHNLQNIQDNVIRVIDILESMGLCHFANKQQKQ